MLSNKYLMINVIKVKKENINKKYINWLHENGYKYIYYKRIFSNKEILGNKLIVLDYKGIKEADIKKIIKLIKKIDFKIISEDHKNRFKSQIKKNNEASKLIGIINSRLGDSKWI